MFPLALNRSRSLGLAVLIALLCGRSAAQECTLPVSPPPTQGRVVFLLDTSGSMEGRGQSVANIFPKIKGALVRGMVGSTVPGSVELLTFDKGPRQRYRFAWPQERAEFDQTVNTLSAPGTNTWLYSSLQSLFASLPLSTESATTVYVITDGLDNNPAKDATLDSALQVFDSVRGPFDKLYYIALGQPIPPEIQSRFASTTFAKAISLPINQAPDLTSVSLSRSLVTVGPDASFAFQHPANTQLRLESDNIGGATVGIRDPSAAGARVKLNVEGSVPAGSVGYMCSRSPDGNQDVLLRFDADTPPPDNIAAAPIDVLGTLKLLNPDFGRVLQRGQSAVLNYRAVNGPVTVEVAQVPSVIGASLPDQTISLLEGEEVSLKVTDKALKHDQQAAPTLRLNDTTPYAVPKVIGKVIKPFPWWWLLTLLLIPLIWRLISWARRPFVPYALSVDRSLRIYLHDRSGRRRSRLFLRQNQMDVGVKFREVQLRGLILERFRPEVTEEEILDNSNIESIKNYSVQNLRRAVKLQAQPETLRLHKAGEEEGVFLAVQETLLLRQLYVFTDYQAPLARVRPPMPPEAPPIEVIVTLLDGPNMQEFELPLNDVDLADVFGNNHLRGLVVRREPGLLRLRSLDSAMRLRHISREFRPEDPLPLAVMLNLNTAQGAYQVRIRNKASAERYSR